MSKNKRITPKVGFTVCFSRGMRQTRYGVITKVHSEADLETLFIVLFEGDYYYLYENEFFLDKRFMYLRNERKI